jgi:DNA polymerase I-like protein with 3'-5' exonuclease and polymerase domains
MLTVLDCENTVYKRPDGTIDLSPYHPSNRLVSVGWGRIYEGQYVAGDYYFFYHNKLKLPNVEEHKAALQARLDGTTLLIGHNIKHDLAWLLEAGFKYDGPIFDTMVASYILERGQKHQSLSLDALAEKYGCHRKLKDAINWDIGIDNNDPEIVEEYGLSDIRSCGELYLALCREYDGPSSGLIRIRDMAMEFTRCITEIEQNGLKIDEAALDAVAAEYEAERQTLKARLQEITHEVMGDTPINLASPEQLSWVIYSRRVNDKAEWKKIFNIGTDHRNKPLRRPRMDPPVFAKTVKANVTRLKKTQAFQCGECKGVGKTHRTKKDGSLWAKPTICKRCEGAGYIYKELPNWAGFRFSPRGVGDCATGGFSTDKTTLERLVFIAKENNDALAVEFLSGCIRLNAIDTYIDSFVGGIRRGLLPDGTIHPKFNQTVTSTQRLSSSEPNFQNMPREKTFPIRKVVVSRFDGGEIWEVDRAQLEFRVAGELADDPVIRDMVARGIDAHKKTGSIIYRKSIKEVTKDERQDSKAHTFAPLYGAMGMDYPEHIKRYYQEFTKTYPGVGRWHKELQNQAIANKKIILPDGKEFAFPFATRTATGSSTQATQIKNFPVQYFATGCIVPLDCIRLRRLFIHHGVKSLIINTVHDSIVIDRHPDDSREVLIKIIVEALDGTVSELKDRFGYVFKMPLDMELKAGSNWLHTEVVEHREKFPEDEIPF